MHPNPSIQQHKTRYVTVLTADAGFRATAVGGVFDVT